MSLKWKICGMRDPGNIRDVAALAPHYMGFIFYPDSPRYVGEEFVMPDLPPGIRKTGVFVNSSVADILKKVNQYRLDLVQLHGDEPVDFCKELHDEGIDLVKVFRVGDSFDFSETQKFEGTGSYFLFDTAGKKYGGNAVAFDWSILKKYNQQVPFFLSGGITAGNVQRLNALKNMNIHAVDINSGAEVMPGIKDVNKIKEIIDQL